VSQLTAEARLPTLKLFLGGEWKDPSSGRAIPTVNPSTGQVLCEIPEASSADVDASVAAARAALPGWRRLSPVRRRDLLLELSRLVHAHELEIAQLEAIDTGMPMVLARRMAGAAMRRNIEYYAGWAERLYGDVIPVGGEAFDYTVREPQGVVAVIIPGTHRRCSAAVRWARRSPAATPSCSSRLHGAA
jgi:acyl-CoA reductase-like NAD-dependent aldehyde dehydrogenase